jgi:type I restriction enzyme, S subunit
MDGIPLGGEYAPRYDVRDAASVSSGTYFERGDLLVAKITPSFENGKQALAHDLPRPFGYATTEVIPLRPRSADQDPRFLFNYLLHPDIRAFVAERMEGSTGRQRVPESALLELQIPVFDLQEQQQISALLERIQRCMQLESQLEQANSKLKSSAMRQLFTRGLRGEEQKETEIGLAPSSWEVAPLETTRYWLQYGTSVPCRTTPADFPVLRIPNIGSGFVDASDLKYCDASPGDAAKYLLEHGDLLFIRTNGVLERLGCCAVYAGEPARALFASYLIRARLKLGVIEPKFLAYFLGSERGISLIADRATPAADGKYNLNSGTIDSLPVPIPGSLEEQREIVRILDVIDQKIALHQRKRAVLESLFRSLLHKLMTGEIRVADLNLAALDAQAPAGTAA